MYDPCSVSYPRDEMRNFLIGVSNFIEEECYQAMLPDNMDISRLIVHAPKIEETRFRKNIRDS